MTVYCDRGTPFCHLSKQPLIVWLFDSIFTALPFALKLLYGVGGLAAPPDSSPSFCGRAIAALGMAGMDVQYFTCTGLKVRSEP